VLIELKGRVGRHHMDTPGVLLLPLMQTSFAVAESVAPYRHGVLASCGERHIWITSEPDLERMDYQGQTELLQRIIDAMDRAVLAAHGRRAVVVRFDDLMAAAGIEECHPRAEGEE
jgi:hypothetical protein